MKICVLFDNLGPYHIARLETLSSMCALSVIERRHQSKDYLWQQNQSSCFERHTLRDAGISVRKQIIQLLDTIKPGVIAVPGWAGLMTICATEWGYRNDIPVIVMSDSQEIDFPRKAIGEWIKSIYLDCCSAAFVAGKPHADYIRKLANRHIPIANGYDVVDNDYFSRHAAAALERSPQVRSGYQLPDHYFLASARFIEKKNLSRLILAFAAFKNERSGTADDKDWKLVILGEGELRPQLEACVKQAGMQHYILLPGFRQYPDLPAYYALAEAFILPSTTEQWGLVVNEAMACGLPVIVSNRCGCAPDLVQDGVNGYLFDPFSIDELRKALHKVAEHTDARQVMGCASKEIISHFSPETFAANLLQLVRGIKDMPPIKRRLLPLLIIKLLLFKERLSESLRG